MNYYNEFDPKAAAWLRELIMQKLIPGGIVDERSIRAVQSADLKGFTQCHFFAGIGGWSRALALAGWSADRPVWTGSCPCQPFSAAGKRKGPADDRHLWPEFFRLIAQCSPSVVFGEQVASKDGIAWLDAVQDDLEGEGYATGAVVLPACGVGAPHMRSRLWFVGYRSSPRLSRRTGQAILEPGSVEGLERPSFPGVAQGDTSGSGTRRNAGSAHSTQTASSGERTENGYRGDKPDASSTDDGLVQPDGSRPQPGRETPEATGHRSPAFTASSTFSMAHALPTGRPEGRTEPMDGSPTGSDWSDFEWVYCQDGKYRPVESGTFPLAHGVPERVVRLRGYGNAIVPEAAAEVIGAYMEVLE